MNNKNIDTILFDFDGTLMDTTNVIMQSWQHVFKTITGKEGDEKRILSTFGGVLEDCLSSMFPHEEVDTLVKIYRGYHNDHFLNLIGFYPGVEDMLTEVRSREYRTALVTSRLKKTTMMAVEKFDLDKYFDTILTANDCEKHKPDPAPINMTLSKLNSYHESAIMIGDTYNDLLCAKNAGVRSVMVGWAPAIDWHSVKEDPLPDFLIDSPMELLTKVL